MNFSGKLWKAWQQSHGLFKVGMISWVFALVIDNALIYITPAVLWNGPHHVREQWIVVTGQAISGLLMVVGGGLRLRQQIRAERKELP